MQSQLTEDDKAYIEQMDSWIKEQDAREKQIRVNIETSSEIARQNEIQLEWHLKRHAASMNEYNEWRTDRGLPPGPDNYQKV